MGHPIKFWLEILIAGCIIIALTGWLGTIGLFNEEPRRALISIEMFLTGNYKIPHLFGWIYYNKPPLFNWVQFIFIKITGNFNEWTMRLPSIISFLVLGLLNWQLVKRYINKETALFSTFFLMTSGDLFFYGSVYSGEIDLFFTLLVYLQAMSLFGFFEKGNYTAMFVVSYFFTAMGLLTKGFPAIVFQGITLLTVIIAFGKWKLLFSWKHLLGIIVLGMFAGGYLLIVHREGILNEFLIRQLQESFQRTAVETTLVKTILGILVNPFRIAMMLLPWSLFLVYGFRKGFIATIKNNRLVLFSMIFILANLPIYWLTGDFKGRYIYPFFPFFCILFGYLFTTRIQHIQTRSWLYYLFGAMFVIIPLGLSAIWLIPLFRDLPVNYLLNILLIIVSAGLTIFYFKGEKYRIYMILFLIVVARMGFNNTYLVIRSVDSRTSDYISHVDNILKITGNKQVYITGTPNQYPNYFDAIIPGLRVDAIETAPYIAFQVPYYLTMKTGKLLLFEQTMVSGSYYLMTESYAYGKEAEILYSFYDGFIQTNWLLVQAIETRLQIE